ncbi:MAG: LacI family DNA-binding transcriptional regulator [Adhaeribacter sp.]
MESLVNGKKDITIYDLAKDLQISPATVSRALNDHPAVNKNTKKKIFARAQELGYQSNTFASNLRRQRSNTIGVIVPHLNSYFVSSAIAGMEKVANAAGFTLLISQSLETPQKEAANAHTLFNSRVDGLLVSLASDTEDISHLEPFIKKGIPVLFFDRVYDDPRCATIVIDNQKAGFEATSHLIGQGCRRLVHITHKLNRNVYSGRLQGFKQALATYQLPFDEQQVLITNLGEEADRVAAARQLLQRHPLPDAVFAANDAMAVTCIREFKKAGLRVPQDIAVVGFNDEPIAGVIEPNLTTVHYPGYEMGEIAARHLVDHLSGGQDIHATHTIILRSDLVIRESSLTRRP